MAEALTAAKKLLKQTYGFDSFRGMQADIIEYVIKGGHAFVLMPTGSGKSLCYQLPAVCRQGVGIVISPLIALMEDQVTRLKQVGIKAQSLNSTINYLEIKEIYRKIQQQDLDLLFVAPERVLNPDFLQFLQTSTIALIAIDEAHCVSQWGHDFRPDYQALDRLIALFPDVPRIALTATADEPTRKDIIARLQLEQGKQFISGFDRPNIYYQIVAKNNPKKQMLDFVETRHKHHAGIVYCLSRKLVEQTAQYLKEQGFNALPYHAGLASKVRNRHQAIFLQEEQVIMVATIAFGMGIDKPDVRFVIHFNLPRNIEAYYQETGRAGRDGLPSDALMLYGINDTAAHRYFIDSSNASLRQKKIEHQKLNALLSLCEAVNCRREVLLNYFADKTSACGFCDNCDTPPNTFDGTTAILKALSCVYRTGQAFGINYNIDILLGRDNDSRISDNNHHKLSTFGIGKEYSRVQWTSIFRQLVALDLVTIDLESHGVVAISAKGRTFLKQRPTIQLRALQTANKNKKAIA